jgi:hypothetical protein
MLLVALAIAWLIHMFLIALNGSIYFIENNPYILWAEISAALLITIFAISVLIMQLKRLSERRRSDDRRADDRK